MGQFKFWHVYTMKTQISLLIQTVLSVLPGFYMDSQETTAAVGEQATIFQSV